MFLREHEVFREGDSKKPKIPKDKNEPKTDTSIGTKNSKEIVKGK